MTTEDAYVRLDFKLIDCTDMGDIVVCMYEQDVVHFIAKSGAHVDMNTIYRVLNHVDSFKRKKYFLLSEFEEFADSDPEVREWKVSEESDVYKHAEAIVISSFAQKLVANFYLSINRPQRPTRVFTNLKDAEKWLRGYMEDFQKSIRFVGNG